MVLFAQFNDMATGHGPKAAGKLSPIPVDDQVVIIGDSVGEEVPDRTADYINACFKWKNIYVKWKHHACHHTIDANGRYLIPKA